MKFFEDLFKIPDNNYYGVSGLTLELNCIYIYDVMILHMQYVHKFMVRPSPHL